MTNDQLITLKEERVPIIQGKPFYNESLPTALEQAQKYAGKKGYVASMPHLLLNFPHSKWYTANSEEDVGIDTEGQFGEKGQPVVLTIHGGGILGTPERIKRAYADKLTPQYAAKFSPEEFAAVLRGEIVGRKGRFPVYRYEEFLEESASATFLEDHRVYGVLRSFESAKKQPSGDRQKITDLVNQTQVIVYAGGKQRAAEAMERAAKVYKDGKLGVWHPFNTERFNSTQAQGRLLFLGYFPHCGLSGLDGLYYDGRFLGVAAEPHSVRGKREARAEKNVRPTLDQILRVSQEHVSLAGRKEFEDAIKTLYR